MVYGYALPRPSTPCPASLRPKCTPPLPKRLPCIKVPGLQSPRLWPGKHFPLLLLRRMWLISRGNLIAQPRCSWEDDECESEDDEGNSQEPEANNDESLPWTMLLPTRISQSQENCTFRHRRGDQGFEGGKRDLQRSEAIIADCMAGGTKKH